MEKENLREKEKGISIAYQNKDISSKFFAEEFKDTFFKVYGLNLPEIVRVEPTELPAIEVNEMSMDNLYYLADGSYAIVDYESAYSEENKVKYLGYVARFLKRVYNQDKIIPKLRVIIIYTADVREGTTASRLDMGDEQLKMTEVFLANMDADAIINEIGGRIINKKKLSDEDKLRLMICPLAKKGKSNKIKAIHKVIELAKQIEDSDTQRQIVSGLLAFTDKVISKEDVEEIRRIIAMTKFDKLIYDEKMEAINENSERIAKNFLNNGFSVEDVSINTGLDRNVVEELARNIKDNKVNKDVALV